MLQIRLFGPLEISDARGQPLKFATQKEGCLFAYLCLHRGDPQSRDALAGLFWPESSQRNARSSLRQALYNIRKALDGSRRASDEILQIDLQTVEIRANAPCWVDVEAFRARIERAGDQDSHDRIRTLEEAVELYRGDFLEGFYEDWCLRTQDTLRTLYVDALKQLMEAHADQGRYKPAIDCAKRCLAMAPLDESVHRELIYLYYASGDRNAALEQYRDCEALLKQELGTRPEPKTRTLVDRIDEACLPPQEQLTHHNLPLKSTALVGRERELADLKAHLTKADTRIVTLAGPCGIGKTHLAIQCAYEVLDRFTDAVHFASLAFVNADRHLPTAIAATLDLDVGDHQASLESIVHAVRGKSMLVILDNFEHVLDQTEHLLELAHSCPQLKILVTSQERLKLEQEVVVPLDGLAYPSNPDDVEAGQYPAVQLFEQRARRVDERFELDDHNRSAVVRICQLLQGIPLGIELAAAWVRVLACEEIAERIEDNVASLTQSKPGAPSRHQSLTAAFDHSWGLLSPEEHRVLMALTVFRDGFTRATAEAVADASLSSLLALAYKSLVVKHTSGRYDMHELLREHGHMKLEETPDLLDEIHERHCRHFLGLLQRRTPALSGRRQREALSELIVERENVRAAWEWAVGRRDVEALLDSIDGLFRIHDRGSLFHGGRALFANALEQLAPDADDAKLVRLRQRLQARLGHFCHRLGKLENARRLLNESLKAARQTKDVAEIAFCLNHLGIIAALEGDYERAQACHEESLEWAETLDDPELRARALHNLARALDHQGRRAQAYEMLQEALSIARAAGHRFGMAVVLDSLGELTEADEAVQYFQQSYDIQRELGDTGSAAVSLMNLGAARLDLGQLDEAERCLHESLEMARTVGWAWLTGSCLNRLGRLALERGAHGEAARFFARALQESPNTRARPVALEGLVGAARLLQAMERPERAVEVAAHVVHHPAAREAARERARKLLCSLKAHMRHETWDTRCERGTSRSLHEMVSEVSEALSGD